MLSLQDWVWYYQVEKKMCLELAPKFTSMFEVHHNKDRCKKGISISYGFITNLIPSLIFNRTFFLSNSFFYFPCYMLIKAFLSFLTSYCPIDWYKLILVLSLLISPPPQTRQAFPFSICSKIVSSAAPGDTTLTTSCFCTLLFQIEVAACCGVP